MAYLGSHTSTILGSLGWVGRVHREGCAGISGKRVVAVTMICECFELDRLETNQDVTMRIGRTIRGAG
jgi:hypothetical protein